MTVIMTVTVTVVGIQETTMYHTVVKIFLNVMYIYI